VAPSHHHLRPDLAQRGGEGASDVGHERRHPMSGTEGGVCVCGERERDLGRGREWGYGKGSVVRAGVGLVFRCLVLYWARI